MTHIKLKLTTKRRMERNGIGPQYMNTVAGAATAAKKMYLCKTREGERKVRRSSFLLFFLLVTGKEQMPRDIAMKFEREREREQHARTRHGISPAEFKSPLRARRRRPSLKVLKILHFVLLFMKFKCAANVFALYTCASVYIYTRAGNADSHRVRGVQRTAAVSSPCGATMIYADE